MGVVGMLAATIAGNFVVAVYLYFKEKIYCYIDIVHLVLVKYIGLYAAPVSTIVAFGSMAVYRYFDLKKYLNVPLPMSVLLLVSGMFVLSCVSFYSKNTILQIVIFFVIAVVCVIANRSILMEAVRLILGKLNRLMESR